MCGKGDEVRKMYAAESFLLRASIVLGMVAAVVTILYFSPMPDQLFRSCDRPCHDLDWPMICRVKLTIEPFQTSRSGCSSTNETDCDTSETGLIRGSLSAKSLLPGPSIQVCQNDILVVDVVNKLPGHGLTIHWRGQPQTEAPFMDGAPMITQCPINSYTTFQYKFRASAPGTHLWHAYSGSELAKGIFGALVVRKASKLDPQRKLYDQDEKKHLIVVSEWYKTINNSTTKQLLINGKSSQEPYVFEVKHGKRYRLRVVYEGSCPLTLSVQEHHVKVISLDGHAVHPYQTERITISRGERVDFVLKASRTYNSYKLRASTKCEDGAEMLGEALISYVGGSKNIHQLSRDDGLIRDTFTTSPCFGKSSTACLADVQNLKKMPKALKHETDYKFYLPLDYELVEERKDMNRVYRLNNITFTYPPSPLLTQIQDVPGKSICTSRNLPESCLGKDICECTHVEDIKLGSTVEIVLIDQAGDSPENIFHLHGHSFYVVASRTFDSLPSLQEIKTLDTAGVLFKRNLISPVEKDTIRIPRNGVVALRFIANNPGFWMLRDGNADHWTRGADMVFHVGAASDIPAPPTSFPTCGSWVGPEFFLL